jgi:hypothetical protein
MVQAQGVVEAIQVQGVAAAAAVLTVGAVVRVQGVAAAAAVEEEWVPDVEADMGPAVAEAQILAAAAVAKSASPWPLPY